MTGLADRINFNVTKNRIIHNIMCIRLYIIMFIIYICTDDEDIQDYIVYYYKYLCDIIFIRDF